MAERYPRPNRESDLLEPLPAGAEEAPKSIYSFWGLFELLLKAPGRLDPFLRLRELHLRLSTGFAVITLVGMALYAGCLYTLMRFSPTSAIPELLRTHWDNGPAAALGLQAAYPGGILLSTVIVLPCYWYIGALMGVRMPLSEVLTHSLKGKAASTVLVVGLMPIYIMILVCLLLSRAPDFVITSALWLGLLLPFVAALRGAGAIEAGFRNVVATTPDIARERRGSIPTSLMMLWAIIFTLTVPIVMYRAYELTTIWMSAKSVAS